MELTLDFFSPGLDTGEAGQMGQLTAGPSFSVCGNVHGLKTGALTVMRAHLTWLSARLHLFLSSIFVTSQLGYLEGHYGSGFLLTLSSQSLWNIKGGGKCLTWEGPALQQQRLWSEPHVRFCPRPFM